jgi:coenzyme F420-0:L-glutamate ligase/coenzyme F420-1:gamma-L-glutamate ligase
MTLTLWALEGIGEVRAGDDLARIIIEHADRPLEHGDVVVVTSKVISKAAGLVASGEREDLLAEQTDRVVATRGGTKIVRTHGGLTLAAAGIDASNVAEGQVLTLPPHPDRDASELRACLRDLAGVDVAVIITDTAGRAWRNGQVDLAIGAAGITPLLTFDGQSDAYGNVLAVTAPAVADEIASASDLVAGKLGGHPVVVVRGVPAQWLGDDQPGASALVREPGSDLFGLGARDAVRVALGYDADLRGFANPEAHDDVVATAMQGVDHTLVRAVRDERGFHVTTLADAPAAHREAGRLAERIRVAGRSMHQADPIWIDGIGLIEQ